MRYHCKVVLALLVCTAMGASSQNAFAQDTANYRYAKNAAAPSARGPVEDLPMGQQNTGQKAVPNDSSGYVDGGVMPDHSYPGGLEGTGGYPGCDCESCEGSPCGDSCGCSSGCGLCGHGGGSWFVTGEYLNVRAHFSDALAFVEQERAVTTNSDFATQTFHQLDYDYEGSYRVGGGYRLCCCGDEVRFLFTRLNSSAAADTFAPQQPTTTVIIAPFLPAPLSAPATLAVRSSVDVESYDLEFRKTIPLGGTTCSSCSDCCQSACPAWDIVWSGGVRGANVDAERKYTVSGDPTNVENNGTTRSSLQFDGAGLRTGLEGRRYFGHDGWFSVFAKGDLSLLLGDLDLNTERRLTNGIAPDQRVIESMHATQIVPVTELEAGITASVTCRSTFSAGYMLSAWHDLGFRDEGVRANVQDVNNYDDANILGFDGFFARYEWAY
jgi:Legionella pneumophila major outer membrane protein precursor